MRRISRVAKEILNISFWTSGQPVAETSTSKHATLKTESSMLSVGFEPIIPSSERP